MQAWATIAGAAAVVWVAQASFTQWLQQRQTERKIAAGERVLMLVYRLKMEFPAIRSPALFSYESRRAEKELEQSYEGFDRVGEGQKQRLRWAQAITHRLYDRREHFEELVECLPLARAFFGEELEKAIEGLWRARGYINASVQGYGDISDFDARESRDFLHHCENDFWEHIAIAREADDRVAVLISTAVDTSEHLILPMIAGRKPAPTK
jgi:hypothetical protein